MDEYNITPKIWEGFELLTRLGKIAKLAHDALRRVRAEYQLVPRSRTPAVRTFTLQQAPLKETGLLPEL